MALDEDIESLLQEEITLQNNKEYSKNLDRITKSKERLKNRLLNGEPLKDNILGIYVFYSDHISWFFDRLESTTEKKINSLRKFNEKIGCNKNKPVLIVNYRSFDKRLKIDSKSDEATTKKITINRLFGKTSNKPVFDFNNEEIRIPTDFNMHSSNSPYNDESDAVIKIKEDYNLDEIKLSHSYQLWTSEKGPIKINLRDFVLGYVKNPIRDLLNDSESYIPEYRGYFNFLFDQEIESHFRVDQSSEIIDPSYYMALKQNRLPIPQDFRKAYISHLNDDAIHFIKRLQILEQCYDNTEENFEGSIFAPGKRTLRKDISSLLILAEDLGFLDCYITHEGNKVSYILQGLINKIKKDTPMQY